MSYTKLSLAWYKARIIEHPVKIELTNNCLLPYVTITPREAFLSLYDYQKYMQQKKLILSSFHNNNYIFVRINFYLLRTYIFVSG